VKRLILAVVAVAAVGVLAPVYMQAGGVEWLLYVDDYDNPLGKPALIRVWAYDPVNLENYEVTCNITATNESHVVVMDSFSGAPAEYEFTLWSEDALNVTLSCAADAGNETVRNEWEFTMTFHYPNVTVSPSTAPWGRPFDLTLETEYPYSNLTAAVNVSGRVYNVTLAEGKAVVPGIVLYNHSAVEVEFLGRVTSHVVNVELPDIVANVTPREVKVGEYVELVAFFVDGQGVIPTDHPINYTVQGCTEYTGVHPAGETVTIAADAPGTCVFHASAFVAGETIYDEVVFTVLPPVLVDADFAVDRVNSWVYNVSVQVATDVPVNGSLLLYLDGVVVENVTGSNTEWSISLVLNLTPGDHEITAVFEAEHGVAWSESVTLTVPRYPYTIELPPALTVPFGADLDEYISDEYTWYIVSVGVGEYIVYVYYPGDDMYAPAAKLVNVTIVYPRVVVLEEGDYAVVNVTGGQEGARITVYGVKPGGERLLLYEAVLRGPDLHAVIPGFGSGYFVAVYSYNGRNLTFVANEPEPVEYTTECLAGVPCVPVAASDWVETVFIGGEPYEAGSELLLAAGEYRVVIVQADGTTVEYTLVVEAPPVAVHVDVSDPSHVTVDAPPGVTVVVVLESGRTVEVAAGEYRMPEPVAGAYSPYFPVEVVWVARVP